MNKKYLSALVIVITLVLSIYMIVKNQVIKTDVILVSSKPEHNDNKSLLDSGLDEFLKEIEGDIAEKNTEEINNELDKLEKQIQKGSKDSINQENNEKNSSNINKANSENFYIKENKSNFTYPVFKIDKTEILKDMSLKDKATLTTMMTKLSMQDCATIMDNIKKYGELECVIKINDLLKKRLSDTDYKTIENIFEKYINMQVLK